MSLFNTAPRTVAQITGNLQKIVAELEVSEQQYKEKISQIEELKARLDAESVDVNVELTRNATVAGKLRDLLGS